MAAPLTSRDLRAGLSDALGRVAYGRERLVVTRQGKQVAALVPIDDLRLIEELEDLRDAETADRALADFRASGEQVIPLDDVADELLG